MTALQFLQVEDSHNGSVATLTLTRPERLNALDAAVLDELLRVAQRLAARPELRCVIITGAGKAFVAGADIAAMRSMSLAEAQAFASFGQMVFDAFEALPVPVIAAVNGFALGGGCELALACDLTYAATTAKFGLPEVKLGVIPGFGGTQRLPRRVGPGAARELIYSGKVIDTAEALRIGLVDRVCEPEALLAAAQETAVAIAAAGPLAVRAAKALLHSQQNCPPAEARRLETHIFAARFVTEEQREGMAAFVDKRPPKFSA